MKPDWGADILHVTCGKWVLPNAIVVSLTDEVRVEPSGTDGVKVLHVPGAAGKFAYILDGQHRLEGFKYTDGIEFDMPVVAIQSADDALRGKVFADINSKQERVTDVLLLSLYYQIKDLPLDDAPVMDVVKSLNTDPGSPLKGKIKMMDTDRGTWIKNVAVKQWLSPHLTPGGVLAVKTVAEKTQVIKEYFKAISELWPDPWGDPAKYNLCRPLGFEIMLGLFGAVKTRCDLNRGRQYTAESFKSQMEPLRDAVIELPTGGHLTIDWQRGGAMGYLSNRAARSLIMRKLADLLRRADEEG